VFVSIRVHRGGWMVGFLSPVDLQGCILRGSRDALSQR